MKQASILSIIGTFLLVVSQNEVYARNYFLWALGLETTNHIQGNRNLANSNFETRDRIANNRVRRREVRREGAAVAATATDRTDAAAAEVETIVLEEGAIPLEASAAGNGGKRMKEHARKRQKEELYEKKEKKHKNKVAAIQSVAEVGTKRKGNKKAKAITTADGPTAKYEKKTANRAAHKTATVGAQDRNGDVDAREKAKENVIFPVDVTDNTVVAANAINRKGVTSYENAHEKKKEKLFEKKINMKNAHAEAAMERAKSQTNVKQGAHERQTEKHFEKKLENRKAHQAETSTRTFETSTPTNKKREHAEARQEEKKHEKRVEIREKHNEVVSDRAGGTSQHKRGFNKKKQERIQQEHAGEPRNPRGHKASTPIDTVSLRDGGSEIPTDTIPLFPQDVDTTRPSITPVVALYWGIFNNPEACPQHPCKLLDAFDPDTEASILHGTGGIPDDDGNIILVSTLYRTPKGVELGGPAPIDGLEAETSGALTSPGFYNTGAEVVVGIRTAPPAESGTMAQVLELTEAIAMNDLDDFVQYASFQSAEIGFGELMNFSTEQVVKNGALVHLTRQNDVLQVYVETNVMP